MKRILICVLTLLLPVVAWAETPKTPEVQTGRVPLSAGVRNALRETNPEFFKTAEAVTIGDQVLLWQRCTGGWPKNIDMARPMSDDDRQKVLAAKQRTDDSTIDNDATSMQMIFLARLYQATGEVRFRDSFRQGVLYLLDGQYANGGWPQIWPNTMGYHRHITYNDDAIVNTLELIRDMYDGVEPYGGDLCDPSLRKRLKTAFDKGIECILNTQIRIDANNQVVDPRTKKGVTLTIWCQQHDCETLMPAPARAFELPAYSTQESARIVQLLMQLPNPDARVKAAIHGAMQWFDTYKLSGLRLQRTTMNSGRRDTRLVADAKAKPIWGRYYDFEEITPYVCDRDGIRRRKLEQIGFERRSGYSWYNARPLNLYNEYAKWADKFDPQHKLTLDPMSAGANASGLVNLNARPTVEAKHFNVVVERGQSIQKAIEQAPEQGTEPFLILVRNGLYNEKVIIDRPNIVLVGENRDSCIIVGAEDSRHPMMTEYRGQRVPHGILVLTDKADDALISGFTIINNFGTTVTNTTSHQFTVYGQATRTILINSNIISDGNDALSLWGKGEDGKGGFYYHADLFVRCPGVDFICPRGTCYATRCRFFGDTRAIIWHDGRGDINNKFVLTNCEFDAIKPTPLGRYHHDSQFFLMNCELSERIIDTDINHAYKAEPELAVKYAKGKIDPCPWGHRVYYYATHRDGGHSGWLNNNTDKVEGHPVYYTTTAPWTFGKRWDPEQRIRDLWYAIAY